MNRWPQQIRHLEEIPRAIDAGAKRICVVGPTGSGKTRMQIDLLEWASERHWPACQYTNRRGLFEQTMKVLESHGIEFGCRAAGYKTAYLRDIQLCMTPTEGSKVYRSESRALHEAKLIIVDEAHVQKGGTMEQIMRDHIEQGAVVVGYTATPLDIGHLYDELIPVATVSECRSCGSLIAAHTYAPDEPDLRNIKRYQVGEDLSEKENAKAIMRPGIFGRVYDHWRKLNADCKPTILFAPGVKESLWFAEEFQKKGVKAAHIDGNDVWIDGEWFRTNEEGIRDRLKELSKSGEVSVVCNRFVLREGIDWPFLEYGILATVFGALTSYLQSCGRLLRACEGKGHCTIQDHGGNWWRHGSLNADRDWSLGLTNHRVVSERLERMREKKEPEPITCAQCGKVRPNGATCPACGFVAHNRSRMVVQVNGTLKPVSGDILKPRRVATKPDTQQLWEKMYYRFKRANRTFNQAYAYFFVENHYYPPKNLPMMPVNSGDWYAKIGDVPRESLRRSEVAA